MKKVLGILIIAIIAMTISCRTSPKAMSTARGKPTRSRAESKISHTVAVITVSKNTVTRSIDLFGSVFGNQQVVVLSKLTGRVTEITKPEGSSVNDNDAIIYVLNDIPGMDYKPGPVQSPISGQVGKIYVEIGQTIAPGIPVATVANYSPSVKAKAPISDQDLGFIKKGSFAEISVTSIPSMTFEGRVTNVSTVVDQMSGAATVEVTLSNRDKKLIPGMACNIKLEIEKKSDVIALPLSALFTDGFSKVLIVDKNIAHFRDIKVGLIGSEFVEILSGLSIGEKVITTGKERVGDGDQVTAIEVTQ